MKILSYNIQAGIGTKRPSDYITKGHHQFFHSDAKTQTLEDIAAFIADFDIVCLQEVDLGGRRSGFTSQLGILQSASGLTHAVCQTNRVIGRTSIHGNAILSRHKIYDVSDHKLPSRIPGRGTIVCRIGDLSVINTHLSLLAKTQTEQLAYISSALPEFDRLVLTGDLNCTSHAPHLEDFAARNDLNILTTPSHKTFPAWRPKEGLDHILVSEGFGPIKAKVHAVVNSDHRPVSITLPS